MFKYTGLRVTLANGDVFKSDAVKYTVHEHTGVLVLADREQTCFAPGTWTMVRMIVEEQPCTPGPASWSTKELP